MASVHKTSKSRYWEAHFRDATGRQISRSTKETNRRKAMVRAVAFEEAARASQAGRKRTAAIKQTISGLLALNGEDMSKHSVRGWIGNWLKGTKNSNAAGTFVRYEIVVNEFMNFLGSRADIELDELSVDDVRNFRDNRVEEGLAPTSANIQLKVLRACFNAAVKQGLITYNPANGVETLAVGRKHRKPFTHEQVLALLRSADAEWRGLIFAGYYIGARLAVCAGLQFENVDFSQRTLTYTPNKQRRSKQQPDTLTVPVHPEFMNWMLATRRTTGPLFPKLSKEGVSGAGGLSLAFRALMNKAGIKCDVKEAEGKGRRVFDLSFHSLRHTFNSTLANAGISQEIRQKLIGHASADVNDIYTHIEIEPLRNAIDALPALAASQLGNTISSAPAR